MVNHVHGCTEGDGTGGGGDSESEETARTTEETARTTEEMARMTAEKRMLKEALGEILNEIPAFREWAAASKAKKKAPGKGKGPVSSEPGADEAGSSRDPPQGHTW